jgi:hypothetical protein
MKKFVAMKDLLKTTGIKYTGWIILVIVMMSCKRDNNYTGHAYFPDMAYSYAFET